MDICLNNTTVNLFVAFWYLFNLIIIFTFDGFVWKKNIFTFSDTLFDQCYIRNKLISSINNTTKLNKSTKLLTVVKTVAITTTVVAAAAK